MYYLASMKYYISIKNFDLILLIFKNNQKKIKHRMKVFELKNPVKNIF